MEIHEKMGYLFAGARQISRKKVYFPKPFSLIEPEKKLWP
jgi:hypothetical protein